MSMHRISCVFTALLGCFCASALAGEGWYVGAGGLYTDVSSSLKYDDINDVGTIFAVFEEDVSEQGFGGQINGGYQWLLPLSYGLASFAIELAGEFQSIHLEESRQLDDFPETPIKIGMDFDSSLVLTAKPGFFITNNLMIFGEVGAVYTQIRNITSDAGSRPGTKDYHRYGDYGDKNLVGFRAGAGINFLLTKSLSLEAGWRYSTYSGFDESRTVISPDVSQEEIHIGDITTEQAFLGFHYYFG